MQDTSDMDFLENCLKEEDIYQFQTLSRENIYELGQILINLCNQSYKPVAAEIKVNNQLLFCYYPEGTSEYYRQVLVRKHNTANVFEKSSLRFYAENIVNNINPVSDMFLSPQQLQFRGGGFPIRLKGGCVIGSIAVAGMQHTEDHSLIVQALKQFFSKNI